MCTNFVLIKKNSTFELAEKLGVNGDDFLTSQNFKPGSTISIIKEQNGKNCVMPAIWWLYLQQTDEGLKPHKDYFSVNTNHGKLAKKIEYKKSRCIVPASAFVESQGGKNPHLLEPEDGSTMAFGGLYKVWADKVSGEMVHSASIITLGGHKALENIHRKSMPLWLPENAYDAWLDSSVNETQIFNELLTPALRTPLRATPIDKTMSKQAIGESFLVG